MTTVPMDRAHAVDPVLRRVDDLARIAREGHAEDRIDDVAHDLAVRYVAVVRAVLPRISGWGAARAGLLQATDQAVALMVRFMRVPTGRAGDPTDAWLPNPTVAGILVDALAVLVRYAESLDAAVTDADVARLLELQRAVDLAFGPGFRPAHGIGDPASVPPQPDPEPEPGPSWIDALLSAVDPNTVVLAVVVVVLLAVAVLAVVVWGA